MTNGHPRSARTSCQIAKIDKAVPASKKYGCARMLTSNGWRHGGMCQQRARGDPAFNRLRAHPRFGGDFAAAPQFDANLIMGVLSGHRQVSPARAVAAPLSLSGFH